MRPRVLDLFCGGGGAGMGFHRAGFTVLGVDHLPQPNYPFEFIQADALQFLEKYGSEYDLIHASPPCQYYSRMRNVHPGKSYPDLVGPVRSLLQATRKPYVIENVVGAPLINPIVLCGTMFGLKVFRHRLFETEPFLLGPPHISHKHFGRHAPQGRPVTEARQYIVVTGNFAGMEYARAAMGIDWMTRKELSQAIPPAYTEWLGKQLITCI